MVSMSLLGQTLKNLNRSIKKKSILINKPWALIDDEMEIQKLIFKKDGSLILSRNGSVSDGSWEYLPEAKSLIIDRGTDKLLCNDIYVDENVILLKLDGTNNHFFALANQNSLPDLNVAKYLYNQVIWNYGIKTFDEVDKSSSLEVYLENRMELFIGAKVTRYLQPVLDSEIEIGISYTTTTRFLSIRESRIVRMYYRKSYQTIQGETIYLAQKLANKKSKGDEVISYSKGYLESEILLEGFERIKIESGRIVSIEFLD